MVQDIFPSCLDHAFHDREPAPEDRFFSFRDGKVLLRMQEDGGRELPAFCNLRQAAEEAQGAAVYLFCVDGKPIYLMQPQGGTAPDGEDLQYFPLCELGGVLPEWAYFAGITALHLAGWYGKNIYCGRCGSVMEQDRGHTPLLELCDYMSENGCRARILAKLEYLNPAGSVKDRIAVKMIDEAEQAGILHRGDVIIEPTSGNTGIGLACVAAARGYQLIITMPETMSMERRRLLSAYGAKVVLTPASRGMKGAIMKANELADETGGVIPSQFSNPANPECHYETTGPEIWEDTDGQIDIFIAGVGTGGTITGTRKYLKEMNPDIRVIAVEPAESPVLSDGVPGGHKIQGIGAGFIPETLDTDIYDKIVTVSSEKAFQTSREMVKTEGFLCGVSSGAVLYVAWELAKQPENEGKTIVVLFPDSGERYLPVGLFEE